MGYRMSYKTGYKILTAAIDELERVAQFMDDYVRQNFALS